MFERYTEKARRVIFFARYEASQFGSQCIETEHLLLGLLREDKALVRRFNLRQEAIRKEIEAIARRGEKTSTSVDLPLSHECKRVLAFAAEEGERLNYQHVETVHLLLGLLREENSVAGQLLREHGFEISKVREEVAKGSQPTSDPAQSLRHEKMRDAWVRHLRLWQEEQGVTVAADARVGLQTPDFAIYAEANADVEGDLLVGEGQTATPAQEIATLRGKIKLVVRRMENAVGSHQFEKAREYSVEEHKLRQELQQKCEELKVPLEEPWPEPVPFLCIEVLTHRDTLGALQESIDTYLAAGVRYVWLVYPAMKRSYVATAETGLREFKGTVLSTEDPALELPLSEIFA